MVRINHQCSFICPGRFPENHLADVFMGKQLIANSHARFS